VRSLSLAARYTAFAALSIAVNIATQVLSTHIYSGKLSIPISILLGTGTGLVTKYLLDKRFIFAYQTRSYRHEAKTFVLYTIMGLVTTVIFWGTEYAFHLMFASDAMRYFGGIVGLFIGYLIKYQLDRALVFR